MIAFDTNVLTEVLLGNIAYVERAAAIPLHEQAVPVIVTEPSHPVVHRTSRNALSGVATAGDSPGDTRSTDCRYLRRSQSEIDLTESSRL